MGRPVSFLCLVFLTPFLFFGRAAAQIPDPTHCTVPNVVYSPGGIYSYVVTVLDATGTPVFPCVVQIVFSAEVDSLVCWCAGQTHPIIQANTNASGDATFQIFAGGCIDPALVSAPPAIQVLANGTLIGEVGGVSPDAGDAFGRFPWNDWAPGGGCGTGISDGVYHTSPLANATYSFCTDMNSDLLISLQDAVLITLSMRAGECCVREVTP